MGKFLVISIEVGLDINPDPIIHELVKDLAYLNLTSVYIKYSNLKEENNLYTYFLNLSKSELTSIVKFELENGTNFIIINNYVYNNLFINSSINLDIIKKRNIIKPDIVFYIKNKDDSSKFDRFKGYLGIYNKCNINDVNLLIKDNDLASNLLKAVIEKKLKSGKSKINYIE